MSELGKLYPDILLDHHRAPRRSGRLAAPTHAAEGNNPLCGDRVGVTLAVAEGRVLDIGCEVQGCAICRAAGSMMAEAVVGQELGSVSALLRRFLGAMAQPAAAGPFVEREPATGANAAEAAAGAGGPSPALEGEWGPIGALFEARRFPNRRRCATLSWEVLERALSNPNGG